MSTKEDMREADESVKACHDSGDDHTRTPLQVEHLSVTYGQRRVLNDVSFNVRKGSLVGLIGPNGAGKTTLMRAIVGLVRPASGKISCADTPGYVPQRHDIAWDYPICIADMVLMGTRRRSMWRRRDGILAAARALEEVDLLALAHRPIGQLSGGQRQRVLIARALVDNPSLIILDEPFTGLDQPTQDLLSDLFVRLTGQGRSILMSTHDLCHAVDVCDCLLMLDRTLVGHGHPRELRDPQLWMDTYRVGRHSPLLRSIGLGESGQGENCRGEGE